MGKRIIQLLGAMHVGDATGHQALLLNEMFRELGYKSVISAPTIDDPLKDKIIPYSEFDDMYEPKNDVVWMHFNIPSILSEKLKGIRGKKILQFHNITPPHFFLTYNIDLARLLEPGERELASLKEHIDITVADSLFNCRTLNNLGYENVIHFPLIFDQALYKEYESLVIERIYDNSVVKNILFVGRIAPNKRIEDLIRFFTFYKKQIRNSSRLLIVGKYDEDDEYFRTLIRMIGRLGTEDIIFTGQVTQGELAAYYNIADVFLSFSEHEGFFMPLLEAYYFELPVIAYSTTVVPETAGGAALLFEEKNIEMIGELVEEVLNNEKTRKMMIRAGRARLSDFTINKSKTRLKEILGNL